MVTVDQAIKNVQELAIQEEKSYPLYGASWSLELAIIYSLKKDTKDLDGIHIPLSGGVDSSLIVAIGRNACWNDEVHSYTIAKDQNHPDLYFAKKVCEKYDVTHHVLLPEQVDAEWRREFAQLKEQHPELSVQGATAGNETLFILYKWLSQHADTIITGDGPDELAGGYWMHEFPLGWKDHPEPVNQAEHRWLSEMHMDDGTGYSNSDNRVAALRYFWNRLVPDQLIPGKIIAEHVGIETRLPYLDRQVIETISEFPIEAKVGRGYRKKPIKDIASKYLPEDLVYRKKAGLVDALK